MKNKRTVMWLFAGVLLVADFAWAGLGAMNAQAGDIRDIVTIFPEAGKERHIATNLRCFDPKRATWRATFHDSFVRREEESHDGGRTWPLAAEFQMTRRDATHHAK